MSIFGKRPHLAGSIGFDTPISHPVQTATGTKPGVGLRVWWCKQAWWERALIVVLSLFVAQLILVGRPMILTGQGGSMEGPNGLRDGARELCIPLRWWPIVPERIYAFLDPDGNLCLKRAKRVEPDGKVFFLGDNQGVDRDGQPESIDSRSFGTISRDRIKAMHLCTLPCWFDGATSTSESAIPVAEPLTEEERQVAGNQARLAKARRKQFIASGSAAWHKFDGIKIADGYAPIAIVLPEPCRAVGVMYGGSASAVLIVYTDKSEVARLRGTQTDAQRIPAPKGELIRKVVLSLEKDAPSLQMGELTAIRMIE